MEIKSGVLYIVGTPIGNLGDISPRALETLKNIDFIAAEDTRVSLKLLTKFGIKKPMQSCRKHNIREVSEEITNRVLSGESCALITDAGMPCVSDPGAELIDLCIEKGVETEVVPGPSALTAALALSGFQCSRFSFEGFLSVNPRPRKERLDIMKDYDGLLIIYEAPHKLMKTLADLLRVLGDREIAVCRELTKIHEEVRRGKLSEMLSYFEQVQPKGEFVLVIKGFSPEEKPAVSIEKAAQIAADLIAQGLKPADAAREAAKQTGLSKSAIYKEYLNM
ncbi:MAG: 16S rRNA (cytidine(1402)-2'-O)-methyltransferase [Oscillospiraceae bacterium]|nr:16S rRNA (cytidine(1402)-2'-O)-methyltransferase [Oscillospiraceae bacterium]